MAELKYKKYIVTELKLPESHRKTAAEYAKWATRILWLDDEVIEGAFLVSCSWYLNSEDSEGNQAHTHDFDEVLGFFSGDPQNPHDLGGEVEFWLEDEKYILMKSCLIFIPKGMKHCPMRITKVDRPIFHFGIGIGGKYTREDAPST